MLKVFIINAGLNYLIAAIVVAILALLLPVMSFAASDIETIDFDDALMSDDIMLPSWFKVSFLDLNEDIADLADDKKGLILFFSQKNCAYCHAFIDDVLMQEAIQSRVQNNFEIIGIDVFGGREITLLDGRVMTEKAFAVEMNMGLTPGVMILDPNGREVLRFQGYQNRYTFNAMLSYVQAGVYATTPFFRYFQAAENAEVFDSEGMIDEPFYLQPPHMLDRSNVPAKRPLVVFFETSQCHACEILHAGVLSNASLREQLEAFDVVQLDIYSDEKVITPSGQRLTAKLWAEQLGLYYRPSLLFFDQFGNEILRVSSIVHLLRLKGILRYVREDLYQQFPNFLEWRSDQFK